MQIVHSGKMSKNNLSLFLRVSINFIHGAKNESFRGFNLGMPLRGSQELGAKDRMRADT